jgi:hypothetical protein
MQPLRSTIYRAEPSVADMDRVPLVGELTRPSYETLPKATQIEPAS